jgi:hypothetical protein
MRTISENLNKRLIAQAEEAKFQGLDKVSDDIYNQVNLNPLRKDHEEYVYSDSDLRNDVETLLWTAAIRVQDYFGKTANANELSEIISTIADDMLSSIRHKIGGNIIGPYEPLVPGEERLSVEIEE